MKNPPVVTVRLKFPLLSFPGEEEQALVSIVGIHRLLLGKPLSLKLVAGSDGCLTKSGKDGSNSSTKSRIARTNVNPPLFGNGYQLLCNPLQQAIQREHAIMLGCLCQLDINLDTFGKGTLS